MNNEKQNNYTNTRGLTLLLEQNWQKCLNIFNEILEWEQFNTWFEPIKPVSLENAVLTIEVPSMFFYEFIEKNFSPLILKTIKRVFGEEIKLQFKILVDKNQHNNFQNGNTILPAGNQNTYINGAPTSIYNIKSQGNGIPNPYSAPGLKKIQINSNLRIDYRFDNFIEGNCNKAALVTGKIIAERPVGMTNVGANNYNPYVIFSPVGLGKTHLVHAIGNEIKNRNPNLNVLYVNCEKFITEYVDHCIKKNLNDFLHYYQMMDVLIIDDIQNLSTAEKAQKAVFTIFNHLHLNGKQLIFTSDKTPKDIPNVEANLLSRFRWGPTLELTIPDYETKIKIIHVKLKKEGIVLQDDVVNYIAENVNTNVRDLEGVICSLLAHSTSNYHEIDLRLAKKVLKNVINTKAKEISIDHIHKVISEHFEIQSRKSLETSRKRELVQTRQLTMYLSKKLTNNTLVEIGEFFGKHYSTVIHGIKSVENFIETNQDQYKDLIEELKN
ncbi:MAG: chromosomal replication initiator protein DnaA, partial [Sediminibacterium sp.]|nr:chromosomal replication initiator protein DnaA [Sediminibacterium sp.]